MTDGTEVFRLSLEIGFDAFHLSRAGKVRIPDGRPVFPEVPALTPEQVLVRNGLRPGPVQMLDAKADVTRLHLVSEIALQPGNPRTSYCRTRRSEWHIAVARSNARASGSPRWYNGHSTPGLTRYMRSLSRNAEQRAVLARRTAQGNFCLDVQRARCMQNGSRISRNRASQYSDAAYLTHPAGALCGGASPAWASAGVL